MVSMTTLKTCKGSCTYFNAHKPLKSTLNLLVYCYEIPIDKRMIQVENRKLRIYVHLRQDLEFISTQTFVMKKEKNLFSEKCLQFWGRESNLQKIETVGILNIDHCAQFNYYIITPSEKQNKTIKHKIYGHPWLLSSKLITREGQDIENLCIGVQFL